MTTGTASRDLLAAPPTPQKMRKLATALANKPEPFMALGLILNVTFAVITIMRFSINADVSSFMTEGSAAGESFVALNSKYATADPIQILTSLPPGSGFNTSKSLAHLAECASLISEVEGVASVSTILPQCRWTEPQIRGAQVPAVQQDAPIYHPRLPKPMVFFHSSLAPLFHFFIEKFFDRI